MRPRIVAGNWKMYTNGRSARELARAVVEETKNEAGVEVILCPPFPYLAAVADVLAGSQVKLGAQNCFTHPEGAYTGEVSPSMLVDVGCQYVIIGHSERRHGMGETDTLINDKLHAALAAGLNVILCIGETLPERKANRHQFVVVRQVIANMVGLSAEQARRLIIAYEPVWAIGTGETATPEQAKNAHAYIRDHLRVVLGTLADEMPILYGGSVKPDNAALLFGQDGVDGGLIGGASLKADQFLPIVAAARK